LEDRRDGYILWFSRQQRAIFELNPPVIFGDVRRLACAEQRTVDRFSAFISGTSGVIASRREETHDYQNGQPPAA
jgi:hypothetical protein